MGQIDGNFSKQIWKSAVQFQNETVGMNNDLYEFLKWVSKQAGRKDITSGPMPSITTPQAATPWKPS